MSAVRSKNTKIEIKFRKMLRNIGYKFRQNAGNYFGKPDIVFKKYKTVIFIDSCFWHGCPYHCRMPHSNRAYWNAKIKRNIRHASEVNEWYKKKGWVVLRFWEHRINDNLSECIKKIKICLLI